MEKVNSAKDESILKKRNGMLVAKVKSGSMSPIIQTNEKLIILRTNNNIPLGSIIGYKNRFGVYMIHRLVRDYDNKIQTMADNNKYSDLPVRKSQVLGAVASIKIKADWKDINNCIGASFIDYLISVLSKLYEKYPKNKLFPYVRDLVIKFRRKTLELM